MYRTVFWTLWEKVRVGCFKRTALKRILFRMKQINSPGCMHETSARTWCDWENLEGAGGEGGGRGDRDGEHM